MNNSTALDPSGPVPSPLAPRDSVLTARIAMLTQASIGITLILSLLLLQLKGLSEKISKLRVWRRRTDRTIVWIICMSTVCLCFYLVELLQYAVNWTGKDSLCRITSQPFIPILFVITKQFLYFFLYERATIVHESLRLNQKTFVAFRTMVALAVVFGIPAGFYWTFFLVFNAQVFQPEGVCVMFSDSSGPIIAFAVLDTILSICLLALFVYPLRLHLKSISSDHNMSDDRLYKLMRRNMILSTVIMISTFASLVAMVVIYSIHGKNADREEQYWQIYAMFFPSWDGMVSTCAALWMTNIWMPKFLADRIKMRSEEDITQSRDTKDITNSKQQGSKRDDTIAMNSKDSAPARSLAPYAQTSYNAAAGNSAIHYPSTVAPIE